MRDRLGRRDFLRASTAMGTAALAVGASARQGSADGEEGDGPVTASDVRKHFQSVGKWVDWTSTVDNVLHGEPETEVRSIATAWSPTLATIDEAGKRGHNLFITHEPAFCGRFRGHRTREDLVARKQALLDQYSMVLLRCHDTWDRMPEYGIPDAWASHLGFETEPRPVNSFYKICLLGDLTVEQAARAVLERVRDLGQDCVHIMGDPAKRVSRMVVGTGAITDLAPMYDLGADLILATDDGMNSWDGGMWAYDCDIPVLIVNHGTSEKPGMMAMAKYLPERFPGIPCEYIDCEFPYVTVM